MQNKEFILIWSFYSEFPDSNSVANFVWKPLNGRGKEVVFIYLNEWIHTFEEISPVRRSRDSLLGAQGPACLPSQLLVSLGLGFEGEVTLNSFLAMPCSWHCEYVSVMTWVPVERTRTQLSSTRDSLSEEDTLEMGDHPFLSIRLRLVSEWLPNWPHSHWLPARVYVPP